MTQLRLTKTELRAQQVRLTQLQRYLPTLQLKKAMLQAEVNSARIEIAERRIKTREAKKAVEDFALLMAESVTLDLKEVAHVETVHKKYENIAGVEIPVFLDISFHQVNYDLFSTPPWVEGAIRALRGEEEALARLKIAEEKCEALEKELREVSIRVNLFEKILIPRAQAAIRKIRIFLGDQELAAVSQAKVAKGKIEQRKGAIR